MSSTVASGDEQRLRAISALLVTLAVRREQRVRSTGQTNATPAASVASSANGTRGADDSPCNGQHDPDPALAAAAARYIARDLAARRLSEFTSAEGYRLARALAQIGGVVEPVEDLLVEANQMRLHPPPLSDAMSHSAV